jgi:hypothetical protein
MPPGTSIGASSRNDGRLSRPAPTGPDIDNTGLAAYLRLPRRARGGIGRRARFRSVFRKEWWFDSTRAHHPSLQPLTSHNLPILSGVGTATSASVAGPGHRSRSCGGGASQKAELSRRQLAWRHRFDNPPKSWVHRLTCRLPDENADDRNSPGPGIEAQRAEQTQ